MSKVLIQKYNPERDKAYIERMLCNRNELLEQFNNDEQAEGDTVLVALTQGTVIGFLSCNGFHRKSQATLFVSEVYAGTDIGSMLIEAYEQLLIHNEAVEHTVFTGLESDNEWIRLMESNDYRLHFSSYMMERTGEAFPPSPITVRNYDEGDYLAWDRVCELAFYHMRQRVGMYPHFFYMPAEWEREVFAKNKHNMFVMTADNAIVAIGKIKDNEIAIAAVAIEHQSRGYGRLFVEYLVNEILGRGEKQVILEVVKGNFAKTLYESLGFTEQALYRHYIKYIRPETRLSAPPDDY